MKYIRTHLGAKLFLSFLSIVVVSAVVLMLTVPAIVPAVFNRHMSAMMAGESAETMGPMMGQGNGRGQGLGVGGGGGAGAELFANFRAGVYEALGWALAVSVLGAVITSLLLSRGIIRPLREMMSASQRIAQGHYDERVGTLRPDELGQLATRFNQMAEKLEQVETRRRQLIGDVSHELRTPLTAIKGSMEGLIDGVLPASEETFQQIHQEADRLNRLVDDLQELSRVEAGAYQLDLQPVKLSMLVETVTKRLVSRFDARRVILASKLPADLRPLLADEGRALQVLTNLVDNALQHTPEGGQVTISATQNNEQMQISVRDTGQGIPAEHLPHIFDRFYRVDKSRSRAGGGGSGIGLTIAKHLVEAHDGRIWVESEGESKGSAFFFTLPVV